MRSPSTLVLVLTTSRRSMLRMVRAASRRASRAASPHDVADTPSRSIVLMTGIVSPCDGRLDSMTGFTEDELVEAIRKILSGPLPGVVLGPGDDAALVETGDPDRVGILTTDMLVEGVDFEPGMFSPHDLGYRALVVNVSDVAAMAGSPRFGLVALG